MSTSHNWEPIGGPRDPLVATLTERAAELVRRERELVAENDKLRDELFLERQKVDSLQHQLDELILREAARCADSGHAGVARVKKGDIGGPPLDGQVSVDEALEHGQAG